MCLVALDELLFPDHVYAGVDKGAKARGQSRGSTDLPKGTGELGHSLCEVKR